MQKPRFKTILFKVRSKKIKYLGVPLCQHTSNKKTYTENYEKLEEENKDLNKWRDIPCSQIGR